VQLREPDPLNLAQQASEWLVLLTCDDPAERARGQAGFSAWKAADARHARAAARIEAFIGQVDGVRQATDGNPRPAHAALDAVYEGQRQVRRTGRRRAGVALLVAIAVAVPVWFTASVPAPAHLLADVRSSEREWVSQTLPDGTRITLSGASAIDLHFDEKSRTVELLSGDIRVDVAKDAQRPFYVQTPLARIRALGTRFAVSHEKGKSSLEMFESQVAVQALPLPAAVDDASGNSNGNGNIYEKATVVRAGERVELTRQGIGQIERIDAERVENGWRQHQLVLVDRPLSEVLAQLARHRPGGIHYDSRQLASLRVSAVLPLDRPDEALQLLQTSFPELRLRFLADRWVWVDLRAAPQKN
jgi:transmembrane sensor